MTWTELTKILGAEYRKLRPGKVSAAESYLGRVNSLARAERQNSPRLDGLIRSYIQTREWPALHPNDLFFLRERIRFACEYSGMASISLRHPRGLLGTPTPRGEEDNAILEFLLIDQWNRSGVRNWLAPMERLQQTLRPPTQQARPL